MFLKLRLDQQFFGMTVVKWKFKLGCVKAVLGVRLQGRWDESLGEFGLCVCACVCVEGAAKRRRLNSSEQYNVLQSRQLGREAKGHAVSSLQKQSAVTEKIKHGSVQ